MDLSKGQNNTIKNGRVWVYVNDKYNKSIGFEWSLRFNPFNIQFTSDGGEGRYLFSFWFIWVFYISFEGIFNKYPKEWNSMTNNKKGGYLETATRTIGISQYGWSHISLYFWHDGENPWYSKDKCHKIWYKTIWLDKIFIGDYKFHTLNSQEEYVVDVDLPEKTYKIKMSYRHSEKRYKRFYMKPFKKQNKHVQFQNNDIKYPSRKEEETDKSKFEEFGYDFLERKMKYISFTIPLEIDNIVEYSTKIYKENVLEKRSVEDNDWVPYEYRINWYREKKLKRIMKNVNREVRV
jgi:hypothetical protein